MAQTSGEKWSSPYFCPWDAQPIRPNFGVSLFNRLTKPKKKTKNTWFFYHFHLDVSFISPLEKKSPDFCPSQKLPPTLSPPREVTPKKRRFSLNGKTSKSVTWHFPDLPTYCRTWSGETTDVSGPKQKSWPKMYLRNHKKKDIVQS